MKHKYIIVYDYLNGSGNCEMKIKKIKGIDDIKKIESEILKNTNELVCVKNIIDLGIAWK